MKHFFRYLFQPLLSGYKEITPAPMDDPFSNQKFQFIGVNIPYKNSFGALIIAVDPAKAWEERESQQFNAFLQHLTTPEKLCVILNKQDDIVRYSSEPTLIDRVIPTVKFSDNTLEVITETKRKYPDQIHIFSLMINRGVGVATQTGFDAVFMFDPKYVVSMDSDGQHSPDDLDNVIRPLVSGEAQAVIGVRPLKDMPFTRNFANAVMNLLTKIFYKVDVSDSQTGFRAITVDALRKIDINARGYLISSEFIREVNDNNIPFAEVPIQTIYTPETQAKGTNVKEAFKILIQMIKHQF